MRPRLLSTATVCAVVLSAAVAASAQAADFGASFGVAPAQGDALPGPSAFWAGACDLSAASTANGGVGTPPANPAHCIDTGVSQPCDLVPGSPVHCSAGDPRWGRTWLFGKEPAWRLDPVAQAGAHPDVSTTFWLRRSPVHNPIWNAPQADGDTKTVIVRLPPGVVANPNAIPRCASEHLVVTPNTCPPETQVGVATITIGQIDGVKTMLNPVYNVEPRDGKTAELLLSPQPVGGQGANVPIVARARTGADFGVDAVAMNIPGGVPLLGQTLTVWGVPWAESHDIYRPIAGYLGVGGANGGGMPHTGLDGSSPQQQPQRYSVEWGPIKPFFINPTECAPTPPETMIQLDSWQAPGVFQTTVALADTTVEGCADVPFDPSIAMAPTTNLADAPSGLSTDLTIPQNDDIPLPLAEDPDDDTGAPAYWKSQAGLATSQLDKTVVTLPDGFTVNPAGASGLRGCSDAQIGLIADGNPPTFTEDDPFDGRGPECPPGSKIGTAEIYTPLLPSAGDGGSPNLTGDVVLGMPRSTDPESGQMFRLFLVARNEQRGLVAKVAGSAVADRATGRLTATFDKNPRVPFETLRLQLKGGQRGLLATPQRCVTRDWSASLSPWSAAHGAGGQVDPHGGAFTTTSRCGFGFAPTLVAGMSSRDAGGTGTFSFRFSRRDGEQSLSGVTASLPGGLLAAIKDVPLCADAAAASGSCPAASRVGTVDAGAGAGLPYFLEKKGSAYLTGPYKGAPYGLATVVPVEAGPFTGPFALGTIVVRQALHVDRRTAQVTAVSDPLPQIWHGIPLRARQITVVIDRPGFMRNPTDCSSKQIRGTLSSAAGLAVDRAVPFHAANCRTLGFKPRLAMRFIGRRQTKTNGHPTLRAIVTQKPGEAGIRRAEVRLPRAIALDPANARALCEYEDGTKPDLENHCSRGAIVGRARAVSPLLKAPLSGNVYFVKNVRIDPVSGKPRRTLPMIVVALRGEIAVNLRGESDVKRGRLVNTFAAVPDAPISRFALRIKGGRRGILVVTDSRRGPLTICGRQIAEAYLDGHNGRASDRDVRVKTPCKKPRGSRARRAATLDRQ